MIIIAILNVALSLSMDTNAWEATYVSGINYILTLCQGQLYLTSLLLKESSSNKKRNLKE